MGQSWLSDLAIISTENDLAKCVDMNEVNDKFACFKAKNVKL